MQSRCASVPGQELGLRGWGMSTECGEPGPGGPLGGSGPGQCPPPTASTPWSLPRWRACVAAAVLCYINLLNYMNWFIVAGEEGMHRGSTCSLHGPSCCHQPRPAAHSIPWMAASVLQTIFSPLGEFQPSPAEGGGVLQPAPGGPPAAGAGRCGHLVCVGGRLELCEPGCLRHGVQGPGPEIARRVLLGQCCVQTLHIPTSFLEAQGSTCPILVTHTFTNSFIHSFIQDLTLPSLHC